MNPVSKFLLISSLMLFVCLLGYAQKPEKSPYNIIIKTQGLAHKKFFGKITAINDSSVVIMDRKDVLNYINYNNINKIKVYKRHSDVAYTVVSGALALGAIAASQSFEEPSVAMAVGIGGTLGVLALSAVLHNTFHAPEIKLITSKHKINYTTAQQKLSKYIVSNIALKP